MFEGSSRPLRRFLRHTASVPKGFLRYQVLRLLREKPMSGSEIMGEIEKQTDGIWKPSPGSVYPLLSWLQENYYIREMPREEKDITKHYVLTEKGEKFFEEQSMLKEVLQRRIEFFAPPLLSGFWLSSHPEEVPEIHEPAKRLVRSLVNLRILMEENLTGEALREIADLMDSTAEKIEQINERLRRKRVQTHEGPCSH